MDKIKVALVKGESRYNNIFNSLKLIEKQVIEKVKDKNVIIKPNCVSDTVQLASTHVDAIKAVLDFIKPYAKSLTLAEGSSYSTKKAFKTFNYYSLKNKYNLKFVDLNTDKYEEITVFDKNLQPIKLGLAKTMLNADCIISLTIPKTHELAIVTLGIKNVAVGSLVKKTILPYRFPIRIIRKAVNRFFSVRNDKVKVHQNTKAINKNIFEIHKKLKADISIIDGFQAMEGSGPVDGSPVDMKLAIAGNSPLATDIVTTQLMGLNPEDVGYIYYAMQHENLTSKDIQIIGNTSIAKEKRKFKLPFSFDKIKNWK